MSLVQIKSNLKELNLLGIMEDFDVVINQLNKNAITAIEAIDMLLQKEKEVRNTKSIRYKLMRSKIRKGASIEDYDHYHERKLNKDQFRELITLNWCKQGQGLIIVGPTGIGKTYLARALGQLACEKHITTLFSSITEFLEEESLARAHGKFLEFRERYIRPQLLILDDFGMRKLNAIEAEDLREIIEQRSYGKSTLLTTQLPFKHWGEVIGDPIILEALIDRLEKPSHVLQLDGSSYREKLKAKNNSGIH